MKPERGVECCICDEPVANNFINAVLLQSDGPRANWAHIKCYRPKRKQSSRRKQLNRQRNWARKHPDVPIMKWYIGWDPRDALAYEVCRESLLTHASIPLEIVPLKDWQLRARKVFRRAYHVDEDGQMWDAKDGQPFSTAFSYSRFAVPILENYSDAPVGFCDADMLWRGDVAELLVLAEDRAVACVQHEHLPGETTKMTGNIQRLYRRKNWSSLMVMRPSRCRDLTPFALNNQSRNWLHMMCWAADEDITALPEAWNWLDGWSDPAIEPKVVHYTRGTPDMIDGDLPYADEWWNVADSLGPIAQSLAAR